MLTRAESLTGRLEHAQTLKHELEELIGSLGGAAQELRRELVAAARAERAAAPPADAPTDEAPIVEEAEAEVVPEVDAEPVDAEEVPAEPLLRAVPDDAGDAEPAAETAGGAGDTANGAPATIESDDRLAARLVALQMAVAGGNRAEVEGHLRRAFDISEPAPILDDVFGAGTGGETRLVSPETADDGA